MDAQQPPGTEQEHVHPDRLINENPLSDLVYAGIQFIESYGWLILLAVVIFLYIKFKMSPKVQDMKRRYAEERESKKFDASAAQARIEAMEASRRRLQEQHDIQAQKHAELIKEKEEEKRKQRIEDWDGHQQGKGYRSKYKPQEEASTSASKLPKPKAKPLKPADYNPLTGSDGGACSWRPSQRRSGGG